MLHIVIHTTVYSHQTDLKTNDQKITTTKNNQRPLVHRSVETVTKNYSNQLMKTSMSHFEYWVLDNVMVSTQEKCSQGSVCNVKNFTFKTRSKEMIANVFVSIGFKCSSFTHQIFFPSKIQLEKPFYAMYHLSVIIQVSDFPFFL